MNLLLIHRASTGKLVSHKEELEVLVIEAAEANSIYTKMLSTQLGLVYNELRRRNVTGRSEETQGEHRRSAG